MAAQKNDTNALVGLVGKDCTIDFGRESQGKFVVNAKIINARTNFGRVDVKCQPLSGGGACWFSLSKVKVAGRRS